MRRYALALVLGIAIVIGGTSVAGGAARSNTPYRDVRQTNAKVMKQAKAARSQTRARTENSGCPDPEIYCDPDYAFLTWHIIGRLAMLAAWDDFQYRAGW